MLLFHSVMMLISHEFNRKAKEYKFDFQMHLYVDDIAVLHCSDTKSAEIVSIVKDLLHEYLNLEVNDQKI